MKHLSLFKYFVVESDINPDKVYVISKNYEAPEGRASEYIFNITNREISFVYEYVKTSVDTNKNVKELSRQEFVDELKSHDIPEILINEYEKE